MEKQELEKILQRAADMAKRIFQKQDFLSPALFVYYSLENDASKEVDRKNSGHSLL